MNWTQWMSMNYLINKWFSGPFSSWDSLFLLFSNYSRKISALSWLKWRYYQLTNNFCLGVNSNGAQNGNTVCNSNFLSLSSTYYSSLWYISELYSYPCICSNLDIGNILSSFLSFIPVGVIKCSISFTACFPFRPAFSRVPPSAQSRSSSFSYVLPQCFTFMFLLPVLLLFKSSLLHAPRDKPPCKCDMAGVPFPQWTNTTADVLQCPSVFMSSQWSEQGGEPLTSYISYYEFWEEWVNCTSVPQAISSPLCLSQLDNIAITQIGKSEIVSTGALYTVFPF